jgi:UDP-arabinose 4-epimerase
MKREVVLVTGGAGYIGSHACKALSEAGHIPVVYDNLSRGHREAVRWGAFEQGDLLDGERLRAVIREHAPTSVLHFAAFAYVGESVGDPGLYWRNNVVGSLSLLEAMRDTGVRRLVFSSTCATYGNPLEARITETHPQAPVNPYGQTKLAVEKMIDGFRLAHGLQAVALRYFNAAGCDPDGEIGEEHDPEPHLIPRALMAASGRVDALEIFGDDWQTRDGTCVRDYIHVRDLARAHVLALDALALGKAPAACNLGNGRGFSVREVVESVRRVTGLEVPHRIVPRRAGDPAELVGSAELARSALGWVPELPDLDAMVRTAWNWLDRASRG